MPAPSIQPASSKRTVTIVGGGVAGLAAGCALAEAGYRVQLLEQRPYVGGRASSYEHPGTGEVIDNCQHILLGCCTNLIDLYERIGVSDRIAWTHELNYLEPGGRRSVLASSWLPAPLHSTLSFLGLKAFSLRDKLSIARGLLPFFLSVPADTSSESFADWCVRHKQTAGAIKRFWEPILASALNDTLDRISVHYAGKVIRETFLRSAQAGAMGVPLLPLSELYGYAAEYIQARGGEVHLRAGVDSLEQAAGGGWLARAGKQVFASDAVVLALSFEGLGKLLPALPSSQGSSDLDAQLSKFEHAPITGIHLWFDRVITDLPHAVLLDTTIEWMYNKTKLQPGLDETAGSYLELVVSASYSLVPMQRQEIIDLAVRELGLFFPAVREAQLVRAIVTKEVRATFCVRPQLDAIRAQVRSPWPGIALAGDWTNTDWPATMEGAVRSGYRAAGDVTRMVGKGAEFLVPDLPAEGLMRLLGS